MTRKPAPERHSHQEMLTLIAEHINDLSVQQVYRVYLALHPEAHVSYRLVPGNAFYTLTTHKEAQ